MHRSITLGSGNSGGHLSDEEALVEKACRRDPQALTLFTMDAQGTDVANFLHRLDTESGDLSSTVFAMLEPLVFKVDGPGWRGEHIHVHQCRWWMADIMSVQRAIDETGVSRAAAIMALGLLSDHSVSLAYPELEPVAQVLSYNILIDRVQMAEIGGNAEEARSYWTDSCKISNVNSAVGLRHRRVHGGGFGAIVERHELISGSIVLSPAHALGIVHSRVLSISEALDAIVVCIDAATLVTSICRSGATHVLDPLRCLFVNVLKYLMLVAHLHDTGRELPSASVPKSESTERVTRMMSSVFRAIANMSAVCKPVGVEMPFGWSLIPAYHKEWPSTLKAMHTLFKSLLPDVYWSRMLTSKTRHAFRFVSERFIPSAVCRRMVVEMLVAAENVSSACDSPVAPAVLELGPGRDVKDAACRCGRRGDVPPAAGLFRLQSCRRPACLSFDMPLWLLLARWPWFWHVIASGMAESRERIMTLDVSNGVLQSLQAALLSNETITVRRRDDDEFFEECMAVLPEIKLDQTLLFRLVANSSDDGSEERDGGDDDMDDLARNVFATADAVRQGVAVPLMNDFVMHGRRAGQNRPIGLAQARMRDAVELAMDQPVLPVVVKGASVIFVVILVVSVCVALLLKLVL